MEGRIHENYSPHSSGLGAKQELRWLGSSGAAQLSGPPDCLVLAAARLSSVLKYLFYPCYLCPGLPATCSCLERFLWRQDAWSYDPLGCEFF